MTWMRNIKVKTHLALPKARSTGVVRRHFSTDTRVEVQEGIQAPINIQAREDLNEGPIIRVHLDKPLSQWVSVHGIRWPVSAATVRPNQCGN